MPHARGKLWRHGGHIRQLRLSSTNLCVAVVWSQQMPKGGWHGTCIGEFVMDDVREEASSSARLPRH